MCPGLIALSVVYIVGSAAFAIYLKKTEYQFTVRLRGDIDKERN
jgi:hypothetical protein